MFLELTEDNLQEHLANNNKVMVQYSASWCGNCRIMKPKFKKLASENDEVTFLIVDAEKFPNSRKFANVNNLPTFAAFENGELIDQAVEYESIYGLHRIKLVADGYIFFPFDEVSRTIKWNGTSAKINVCTAAKQVA